ncbi:MAG: heme o synthase [Gammaproteobacteria bacterium]|nr:heme o synthase [Gammaproteobacteria bacterium]NNF62255.1 protoheme IX farnesyltransferase [Gammaproteobacteria bacterium]NNM21052.1 protoheme IX farnesyltransferase [Gammaproteobacteria bacterium]
MAPGLNRYPETVTAITASRHFQDYLALCKPRVVSMIVFTAMVGMLLSTPGLVSLQAFVFGSIGIGLAAASAAAINHVLDRRIDERMRRTRRRPLPQGALNEKQALSFAMLLGLLAMILLVWLVNPLTALLTFASLIGYAVIYTAFLKHATPQNIVIGGAAGAAPPVLGWTAVTGQIDPHSLLLFLIIFTWTPPHFWALAISRREEYSNAGVPMLPVTHGEAFTRLHILLYTLLLVLVSLLPYLTGMSGLVYLAGTVILDAGFLYYAIALKFRPRVELPMQTFAYSLTYLAGIFLLLLGDHYVQLVLPA